MSGPGRREYVALAAISSSQGMNLLIPLYLAHLGYAVGVVGVLAGLGALAVLLSRIPVPLLYRPQRSRLLLLTTLGAAGVSAAALPYRPTLHNWGPIVVPEDRYFAMGDNREQSLDSRFWGFVEAPKVKGRAVLLYWSYDGETLKPFPWLTAVRWSRIGDRLR